MRRLCLLLLVVIGLTVGPGSAQAHGGPCPEQRTAAAGPALVTAFHAADHGCGTDRVDCHMPDCCQAGSPVALASVAAIGRPVRAALDPGSAAPSPWAEPVHRVFRPPARG